MLLIGWPLIIVVAIVAGGLFSVVALMANGHRLPFRKKDLKPDLVPIKNWPIIGGYRLSPVVVLLILSICWHLPGIARDGHMLIGEYVASGRVMTDLAFGGKIIAGIALLCLVILLFKEARGLTKAFIVAKKKRWCPTIRIENVGSTER